MRVRDFMEILEARTLERLPPDLRENCHSHVRGVWFQVHFHSPKVHYEVWLARKIERIEIGLHFEGPHDFSYTWAGLVADHMAEIQSGLGPAYELEEWTASWCRLHETVPYDPPSDILADEIATRMARLITVCQPVVDQVRHQIPLGLDTEPARPKGRSRFAHKRRTRT
jgi:hypothetical protein